MYYHNLNVIRKGSKKLLTIKNSKSFFTPSTSKQAQTETQIQTHILLFYMKLHFCHLLPFAKVGQSVLCLYHSTSIGPHYIESCYIIATLLRWQLPWQHLEYCFLIGYNIRSCHLSRIAIIALFYIFFLRNGGSDICMTKQDTNVHVDCKTLQDLLGHQKDSRSK